MGLDIATFSNVTGGQCFFKAAGHPLAAERMAALMDDIAGCNVSLYDPHGQANALAEIYPGLRGLEIEAVYVQALEALDRTVFGHGVRPITDIGESGADTLLIVAYESGRLLSHIRHLLPAGIVVRSLDDIRIPGTMLTNPERYLDPLNFATNFAFFRDAGDWHTRLTTTNYWHGYGAKGVRYWARLFDGDGTVLGDWEEALPDTPGSVVIDSSAVRERLGLADFTGQLFLHVLGIKGHDVVKYALDTFGRDGTALSCTHDANAWPADLYAGLPAPKDEETVVLWVQNSHPRPIPEGAVGVNLMGGEKIAWLDEEIPGFGSFPLDIADLLPFAKHPQQIEIRAGKHFVRPRYEITTAAGRTLISHANVERTDLKPDPRISEMANLMGKGYALPAPVLPPERYAGAILPTPMATGQRELPVAVLVYDAGGREVAHHRFGRLKRTDSVWLEVDELLRSNGALEGGFGHLELLYDFAEGGEADGWLHAVFRYRDRWTGHAAETSFGTHIFNTVLTFKNEPQSYGGPAPGLSTRLFLRVGDMPWDTMCHLIYTTATDWHPTSNTVLTLRSREGRRIAERNVRIPMNGSLFWRVSEMFEAGDRKSAGDGAYVIVRDKTCRLFGYHGLLCGDDAFSLDHMFGF